MVISQNGTAYDLTGPENAPVVVLIHGIGLSRQSVWAPIERWLAGRFRVLSYDLPGHGESVWQNQDVTLRSLSTQLIDLMDELEIAEAALVGFSIGGMINRRIAMDHPYRVNSLIVLNSPHERGPDMQTQVERQARESVGGAEATIDTTLERWFTPNYRQENKALVDEIRAVVLASNAEAFAAHRIVLAEGVKELIRPNPAIACPALVMTCEHDSRSTPQMSRAIADEISGATVEIIPDLQHLGLIERPLVFARKIEAFLEKGES